jgi:CheY-like chemotaxis protein
MAKSILLVEDDSAIREALSFALELEGYKVSAVTNGREALEWLHAAEVLPHVILLDQMMPEMDGIEFRKAQMSDEKLASVPVVMLTASPGLAKDICSLSGGVMAILPKPLLIETLIDTVERCAS